MGIIEKLLPKREIPPPSPYDPYEVRKGREDLAGLLKDQESRSGRNRIHPRYLESRIFGRFLNLKYYGYIVDKEGRNEELGLEPGLYLFASSPPVQRNISDAQLRKLIDNQKVSRFVERLEITIPDTGRRKGKAQRQAYRRAFQQAERKIREKNTQDHDGRLVMWDKNGNEVKDRAMFGAVHE